MSGLNEIIDSLETKFTKLIQKLESLEFENQRITEEISKSKERISDLENVNKELETKYNSLKLANSLLGSEENKRETKLKINSLIKEIDYCVAQLSE